MIRFLLLVTQIYTNELSQKAMLVADKLPDGHNLIQVLVRAGVTQH